MQNTWFIVVYTDRHRPAADIVVFGLMAVHAFKIMASHVHINIFSGEEKAAIQITVFDRVPAAAVKMTSPAICAGWVSDALCHSQ